MLLSTRVPSGGGTTSSPRTAPSGGHASSRPAVEYQRLLRAISIIRAGQQDGRPSIKRLGATQFAVRGNDQPVYYVDLTAEYRCQCKDSEFAPSIERMCKHEMACRLVNQEPGMLSHFVDVIEREEQRKKEAER